MKKKTYLSALAFVGLVAVVYFAFNQLPTYGSAPSGLRAENLPATSSSLTLVADTVTTIFEARRNCNARIISTGGDSIQISFSSTTPNTFVGSVQLASSTEIYDSGLFGCGQWRAVGSASSTLDLNEF